MLPLTCCLALPAALPRACCARPAADSCSPPAHAAPSTTHLEGTATAASSLPSHTVVRSACAGTTPAARALASCTACSCGRSWSGASRRRSWRSCRPSAARWGLGVFRGSGATRTWSGMHSVGRDGRRLGPSACTVACCLAALTNPFLSSAHDLTPGRAPAQATARALAGRRARPAGGARRRLGRRGRGRGGAPRGAPRRGARRRRGPHRRRRWPGRRRRRRRRQGAGCCRGWQGRGRRAGRAAQDDISPQDGAGQAAGCHRLAALSDGRGAGRWRQRQ
jgi:hypothetical protein